jgi:dTMP kinase
MIDGLFIAIEGIDGAGTTTQAAKLHDALRAKGLPVHLTREPSDGPVGVLIRQILSGRVVVPGVHGARPPDWTTMALLFAADRVDHIEAEVVPNLMDGVTVITDRYDFSSVAYQSLTSDGGESTIEWVKTINALARRPDLTIVLDVPHEIAATRRKQRARARELYEDDELQARLASFYGDIEKHFPNDKIVHVDGALPLDEVASAIFAAVAERRGERA